MLALIETVDVNNTLGEGVTWHEQTQTVWWTDIEENSLFSYQPATKKLNVYAVPYRLCAFGFTTNEHVLIAAFDCGIALYHLETKHIEWLFNLPSNSPLRFNDGRVDGQGRFWVGTMNEREPSDFNASLYCVGHDLTVREITQGLGITNGIAWNRRADKFYVADSAQQRIFQYDFASNSGDIDNPKTFATTVDNAFPDGAIIDSEDHLWSAHWGGASLVRYSPNGDEESFHMPVSQPTCVAFGGINNELLFVTTATYGLSAQQIKQQPYAGHLLIFKADVSGVTSPLFSAEDFVDA